MTDEPFFAFSAYHLALFAVGGIVIVARWLPRLVSHREPAAAPLMILFGALAALVLPDLRLFPDPRQSPRVWELVAEMTVIVALFGVGMRIDSVGPLAKWGPTIRMLAIGMPLCILAVAVLGHWWGGMTIAGAIVLGAVLAPTDPVLAADVQVGPPQEGGEHPVRFTLTTEAGLNDGLAFPFVYMGLIVAAEGTNVADWGANWLAVDVVYRIVLGGVMGWAGGRALGYVLFVVPGERRLAETGSGVIAFAGVILCYGSTELVEGYGFIAVAVLGLTLRRIEQDHHFHRRLHDFTEAIEHALTAVLLVALGVAIPALFEALTLAQVAIAIAFLLLVRPVAGMLSLAGTDLDRDSRLFVSAYGVRGIGSIYYLCYAGTHMEFRNEAELWSLVALVILLSTIIHGFTVGRAMDALDDD